MIAKLLPLETEIKETWRYVQGETPPRQDSAQARVEVKSQAKAKDVILDAAKKAVKMGKDAAVTVGIASEVEQANGDEAEGEDGLGELVTAPSRQDSRYQQGPMAEVWQEVKN